MVTDTKTRAEKQTFDSEPSNIAGSFAGNLANDGFDRKEYLSDTTAGINNRLTELFKHTSDSRTESLGFADGVSSFADAEEYQSGGVVTLGNAEAKALDAGYVEWRNNNEIVELPFDTSRCRVETAGINGRSVHVTLHQILVDETKDDTSIKVIKSTTIVLPLTRSTVLIGLLFENKTDEAAALVQDWINRQGGWANKEYRDRMKNYENDAARYGHPGYDFDYGPMDFRVSPLWTEFTLDERYDGPVADRTDTSPLGSIALSMVG